uniref:Uncharacterized protein n=1 Tax=Hyaloperonospora arabidopsidis (strain Emoy2) TaxID=559515 RepID=M4BKV9_HYAAE
MNWITSIKGRAPELAPLPYDLFMDARVRPSCQFTSAISVAIRPETDQLHCSSHALLFSLSFPHIVHTQLTANHQMNTGRSHFAPIASSST